MLRTFTIITKLQRIDTCSTLQGSPGILYPHRILKRAVSLGFLSSQPVAAGTFQCGVDVRHRSFQLKPCDEHHAINFYMPTCRTSGRDALSRIELHALSRFVTMHILQSTLKTVRMVLSHHIVTTILFHHMGVPLLRIVTN